MTDENPYKSPEFEPKREPRRPPTKRLLTFDDKWFVPVLSLILLLITLIGFLMALLFPAVQ